MFKINFCQWLDLNCGPLGLEATALPTEPQPLPNLKFLGWITVLSVTHSRIFINIWIIYSRKGIYSENDTTIVSKKTKHFPLKLSSNQWCPYSVISVLMRVQCRLVFVNFLANLTCHRTAYVLISRPPDWCWLYHIGTKPFWNSLELGLYVHAGSNPRN